MEHCLIDGVEDYVLFDCPGQVELFTHHTSLRNIFFRIQKMGYRVCLSFLSWQKGGQAGSMNR